MNTRPFSYMACLYGCKEQASQRPLADGEDLARQCLNKLADIENSEQFPPKLLILLASPDYDGQMKAFQLLAGIHEQFERAGHTDVQLIGSSVAGVIFNGTVHKHGAVLMCLASRLLNVRTAAGVDARTNPEHAIHMLLSRLGLSTKEGRNADLVRGSCLLTFLPGFGKGKHNLDNPALKLHRQLHAKLMGRIAIAGGVSSLGGPAIEPTGLQFLGKNAYEDTVVTACIESGAPFGISTNQGLQEVSLSSPGIARFLDVMRLSEDGLRIEKFRAKGKPADILRKIKREHGFILLEEMLKDETPVLLVPRDEDNGSITLNRSIEPHASLRVLKADPPGIRGTTADTVRKARARIHLEKPVGCLIMACTARYRHRNEITYDVEAALAEVGEEVQGALCVGGLFDGEIGLSESGEPIFVTWSFSSIVIGDEMLEHSAMDRGFRAMADDGPKLVAYSSLEEAVTNCLDMVFEVGYPGAMLALIMREGTSDWLVAQKAVGTQLQKILPMTRRLQREDDILDIVLKKGEPIFIPNVWEDDRNDQKTIKISGITSLYIIPLKNPEGRVFGTLHIDLGDVSYHDALHKLEKMVLDYLGDEVAATLNRIMAWTQLQISKDLDRVLVKSMSSGSVEQGVQRYFETALDTIGADAGHVRLIDPEKRQLVLIAGKGDYYEHARKSRTEVNLYDLSPTGDALRDRRILVVNDVQNNPDQKRMRERYEHIPEIADALGRFAAYVNVPLFDEADNAVGTVNIATLRSKEQERAWFFTPSLVDSLNDLGKRLVLLISNIQHYRGLKFLLEVGPHLGGIASFKGAREALDEAVRRFHAATEATTVSLFIWDEEIDAYVLRAESGWKEKNWVHSARYKKGSGWTGRMAEEDSPKYFKELQSFKEHTGYPSGRYATQMFGRAPPEDTRSEALALPLRIANRSLGVLTLQWIREKGEMRNAFNEHSGQILQEATDNMAALVDAVMSQAKKIWEGEEYKRRDNVIHALVRHKGDQPLHDVLCEAVGVNFQALRVDFYLKEKPDTTSEILWNTAWHRSQSSPKQGKTLPPSSAREAFGLVRRCASSERIEVKHRELGQDERTDPRALATEGLVVRACIPLKAEERAFGVLDIAWGVKRLDALGTMAFHSEMHLQVLGESIAAIIQSRHLRDERERAQIQADRSQRAVRSMDGMLFQSAHRLLNLIASLVSFPDLLEEDSPRWIEELRGTLRDGMAMVERPLNVARGIARPESAYFSVGDVITDVLREFEDDDGRLPCQGDLIEPIWNISSEILAYSNESLFRESLVNIIDNAIRHGLPRGGVLNISAKDVPDQPYILLVIEDKGGVGMSREQIETAQEGFGETQSGVGVGLLIASLLIETNGGELEVESMKGKGTKVCIKLPKQPLEQIT